MKPTDLNVYQTSKCNSNCIHCSRQKTVPTDTDVTPDLLKDVLDRFPIKSVCIAGLGEPFLSPHLFDNIKLLNDRGIKPGLITNGFLLGPYMKKLKEVDLVYLSVSLNAVNRAQHYAITRTKTFAQVVESIRLLVEESRFPVGMSKVCFREDGAKNAMDFVEFGKRLELDFVHLVNSLPYDWDAIPGVLTEEKDAGYFSYLEMFKKEFDAGNMKVKWPISIKNKRCCSCNSPWQSVGINGGGWITGCRRIFPPSKEFGHYLDENVWEGSRGMIDLRSSIIRYTNKYSHFCDKCFGNYKGKAQC